MILVVFQLLIIPFVFIEDIIRTLIYIFNYIGSGFKGKHSVEFLDRRKFVSQLAILLASIPVSALLIGIAWGKYNFKLITHQLSFKNLPDEFDGFKIVHIIKP